MKLELRKVASIVIAGIMMIPVVTMIVYSSTVDPAIWIKLWQTRIPKLFMSSMLLVTAVTIGSVILGTLLAFLVERTNLPYRKWFRPLLITPLITPCFIIAICYVNFFGVRGVGEKMLEGVGINCSLPNLYGYWGAVGIFILGTFPYVYTIVLAALRKIDPSLSEAARCLGVSRFRRVVSISLPLLMPAISAGAILVALYVFADFGVVSILRYSTFVNMIYEQMSGRYNFAVAASLSTVLMAITFLLVFAQDLITKRRQFITSKNKSYNLPPLDLKLFKIPALLLVMAVLVLGLLLPVGVLVYWLIQSIGVTSVWGTDAAELIRSGINSLLISGLTATAAIVMALPLAYWNVRQPKSRWGKILAGLSQSGVALPGVLVALALSLVLGKFVPQWNFSIMALFLAFLIHFFAKSYQMTQAGLTQISPRIEEGARILGCSPLRTFWHITRPLLSPALMVAWIFVFLSSMRELAASLLLRPAGFDPLTVKVWIAASEGFYEQAAAPALCIVLLSLPMVVIMANRQERYQSSWESS